MAAAILKPIFEFPGGCRFHFAEPSGNEFAVWAKATLGSIRAVGRLSLKIRILLTNRSF